MQAYFYVYTMISVHFYLLCQNSKHKCNDYNVYNVIFINVLKIDSKGK